MRNHKFLFMSAIMMGACGALVTSCGGDDDDDGPNGQSYVELRPTLNNFSRVNDTWFSTNEAISVWAMESQGYQAAPLDPSRSYANNCKFVYDGRSFKGDIKKPDNMALNYYAVYPYSPQNSDRFNFSVMLDQSNIENYMASDLCVGSTGAVTSPVVDIDFFHALCKVVINTDASLGTVHSIDLKSKQNVTVDLYDFIVQSYGSDVTIRMNQEGANSFRAIVPVMTANAGVVMAVIHSSKGDYTWNIEEYTEFTSGTCITFNLSEVNGGSSTDRVGFTATILPWDINEE